jgi:hypothetical protein
VTPFLVISPVSLSSYSTFLCIAASWTVVDKNIHTIGAKQGGSKKPGNLTLKRGGPVCSTWQDKITKSIYHNSHLFVCLQNGFVKSFFYGYEDGNKN